MNTRLIRLSITDGERYNCYLGTYETYLSDFELQKAYDKIAEELANKKEFAESDIYTELERIGIIRPIPDNYEIVELESY